MNIKEKYLNLIMIFTVSFSMILLSVCDGFAAANQVRDNCLRLHILASSDSEEDQNVKLLVRDAVLQAGAELFTDNTTADEAAERILSNKEKLIAAADRVLKENGFSYTATLSIEDEYFETRQYEDVKLPAGTYKACKIVLGEGEGKNWWCIMFPPMCLPAATKKTDGDVYAVFGESGGRLVRGKSGYIIKFRIVELIEEWFNKS